MYTIFAEGKDNGLTKGLILYPSVVLFGNIVNEKKKNVGFGIKLQ